MWIRFGRNEPVAPSLPLRGRDGNAIDLHAHRRGGTLVLLFAAVRDMQSCGTITAPFERDELKDLEADVLVVSDASPVGEIRASLPLAIDERGELQRLYAGLVEIDTSGRPLLFILDRDGCPVYAWSGACEEAARLSEEIGRKLQSAAFLCPECSVPDSTGAAAWGVVY